MTAYVVTAFTWPDPPELRMVHRFENRDLAQRWIERAKAPGSHVIVQSSNPLIQHANELNVWIPDPHIRADVMCVRWSVETRAPMVPAPPLMKTDQLPLFMDAPARAATTDPRSREASHASASTRDRVGGEEMAPLAGGYEQSRTPSEWTCESTPETPQAVGIAPRRPALSEELWQSYSNTERAGNP